jgi:hypothetical protein
MICPNINSPEWQKLTSQVSTHTAYDLWDKYNGNVPQSAIDKVLGKTSIEADKGLQEANASLESKLRNILAQIGVKYEAVQEITGVPGQKLGPIAQADLLSKVLKVVEGRADKTTLTEEVVHFLVAMLDTNSHVYQSMFDAITKYPVFQEVVKEYGSLPGYNEERLRREAMAKLITREVINLDEQSRLTPQQQKVASNWWNMLLSKVKQMFNSFDKAKFENAVQEYSPFKELAYKIAEQDLSLFNQEITDTHTYYQLSNALNEKQKAVLDKIQAISQGISREGTDETRGYYKNGKKLGKSVTTIRDEKFDVRFKNAVRTPEAEAQMKESGRIGSLVHDDMDNISKRILSRDGSIAKVIKTNPTIYAKLENFAKGLMKVHGEDAVYLSEQIVYDPSTDTPGTVDLIVIDKDGKVHIYDWKTMMLNKREKEEFGEPSYYKTIKYEYQLNSYKDIIEKGGVKDFGKRRYIPIENVFKKDKVTGATKFVDININIPGSRTGEKPYLNPVPVSNEKTGDETIDKLISQLLALQKEARTKTAVGAVEQAKKTQKIISLNKAIRDLQLNKNLGLFAETAAVQFKSIEARLADTKTPLSEAELVDMQEELEVYTDLGRKFAPLYEAGKIPEKHVKQFDEISGKASRLAVKINNELATYFKNSANKAGLSDEALQLYKEKGAKPIGLVGKFSRALSRIDHPIFRTFWNLVNKAKTDTKRDSDALQAQIEEKLNALKEWGRSQGLKGTDIFNLMLDKKTGRLISKFSAEFYKTRKQKIADGDWRWMKENTVLDEAGLKKFIKDQEAYIKSTTFSSNVDYNKKIQEAKIKELHDNYDVFNNPKAYASQMDFMKKFLKPSEKWLSEGYKTLRNTKPAFDFYTLFTSKMREFNEFMPFRKDDKWTDPDRFIPNLRADLIEKVSTLGGSAAISGLGEDFSDMFDLRYDEEMRLGQINEFTGEYERQVPVYYTKEIDPKEKSYDLGRVLMLFGNKAYNYKYMSQIEGSARNLRNALADSSEALVDGNGKVIKNLLGSNKIVSATTLDTFDSFVNYYVYGVKESEDYGYFTKQKKVVNPKTGEEEIVDVEYSKNKIGKAVLRTFATKALGLNLISGGAQIFGNNVNSLVLASGGQFFKVKDWVKAKTLVTSGNFNPEVYQFLQVLDIRGDNEIFKRADKLSVNDTMRQANLEKAFFLYEYGDQMLFKTLAVSMIQSHGIDANGKIKLLSKLPEGTKSILEQLTIDKDGKSNLTTLFNEEEYRKFRNKVQALGEKITGMSSRDNMSGWRLSMAGQALMQFRGWIPRTLEARFGGAKFDAELDAVEKGRFVSLWNQIGNKRIIPLVGEMLRGAVTGQFGVNTDNIVDTLYNQFMEENPHLSRDEVTREMFYDMHVANVKAGLMEISLYLALMLLIGGLKEGWDDDDEDKRFKSETLKTLNRFSDEIGFYLNPNSFQAITRGTVPAIGLFTDMGRFFGDLFGEAKGQVFNNEVEVHNNKPLWSFMRAFVPGGTTMWNWFGDKTKMKEKED